MKDACTADLEAMGKASFHFGAEVGAGSRMKLVVNMVMGAQLNALAEGVQVRRAVYGGVRVRTVSLPTLRSGEALMAPTMPTSSPQPPRQQQNQPRQPWLERRRQIVRDRPVQRH